MMRAPVGARRRTEQYVEHGDLSGESGPRLPEGVAQRSLSGSPLGSPATTSQMIDFSARHGIAPVTEHYKMSQINEAFARLHSGKARYRIVLENDFAS